MLEIHSIRGYDYIFFDFVKTYKAKGLAWTRMVDGQVTSSYAKFLTEEQLAEMKELSKMEPGDCLFFMAADVDECNRLSGLVRNDIADHMTNDIREKNCYKFCWIVDFPFFEKDPETGKIIFSHNPFSMPQGGLEALNTKAPLEIEAYQYDVVCNGIELSSGAIRNHRLDIMEKAFEIAGYPKEVIQEKFGCLYNAFKFGAPPHGGLAYGLDRLCMLMAGAPSIRDVIAFPKVQNASELMTKCPAPADAKALAGNFGYEQ